MAISLLSGPQDPSQLDAVINSLINSINAYLAGTGGSVITVPVSAASTGTAIAATAGKVTVNTTTRTAGTTGLYTIAAPVAGVQVEITCPSTVKARITGLFARSKTKLTMSTTASLATAKLPSIILTGRSTSVWDLTAAYGSVTMSS
jgi:hypothetical protein